MKALWLLETETFFKGQERVLEWSALPLGRDFPHAQQFEEWLQKKHHGEMDYMAQRSTMRLNPREFFDHAKSAIVFLFKYPVPFVAYHKNQVKPQVSSYAQGADYHLQVKGLLRDLENHFSKHNISLKMKAFVDSAPVFERDLALLAGLGWVGKNTCLLHKKWGSGFFLGGFVCDQEINEWPMPAQDFCGKCTRCLEACPTDAFIGPWELDARKCISYQTIEKSGEWPTQQAKDWENRLYGCDICQQVCPWNHKHLAEKKESDFDLDLVAWLHLAKKGGGFKSRFKNTALERGGRKNVLRNAVLLAQAQRRVELVPLLRAIAENEETWLKKQIEKVCEDLS